MGDKKVEKKRNIDKRIEKERNSDKKVEVEKDKNSDKKIVDGSVSCKKCGCIKLYKELMKLHDCERDKTEVKSTSELARSTIADCDKEAPGQSGAQQMCSKKNPVSSSLCEKDTVKIE